MLQIAVLLLLVSSASAGFTVEDGCIFPPCPEPPSTSSTTTTPRPSTVAPKGSSVPATSAPSTAATVCSCQHRIFDCQTHSDHENCAAGCASRGMGTGQCHPVPFISSTCLCIGPFAPGASGCADANPVCIASDVCGCTHIIGNCRNPDDHVNCAATCAHADMGTGSCRPFPFSNGLCICVGPYGPGTSCGDAKPGCLATTSVSDVPTSKPPTAAPVCGCTHIIGDCRKSDDHANCAAACASVGMGTGSCRPFPFSNGVCMCFGPYAPGTSCGDAHPECLATTTPSAVTTTIPQDPTSGPGPITITVPAESTSPSTTTEAAGLTTTIKVTEQPTTAKPEARCARIFKDICGGIIPGDEQCKLACQAVGLHVGVCLPIQPLVNLGLSVCVCLS